MTNFPATLSCLNHLRDDPRVRFIEQEVEGERVTIVTYMIADTSLWTLENAIECRGITFDAGGRCISAPFSKFFNLNENAWTQEAKIEALGTPAHVFEKRDGSMITPVMLAGGKIRLKTKRSFYSDVAKLAQACWTRVLNDFSITLLSAGWTPIFEFTHRDAEIVINYGDQPSFTLLAARSMQTGSYLNFYELSAIAQQFNVSVIGQLNPPPTLQRLKEMAKAEIGIEGWVLLMSDGTRVKLKTNWYRALHRVKTDLRERDVAALIADERIDDVKSVVVENGLDLEPIEVLERRVAEEVGAIEREVEHLLTMAKALPDRKSVALTFKNHPLFGLLMVALDGREPSVIDFWKRRYLSSYSLRAIFNQAFGE